MLVRLETCVEDGVAPLFIRESLLHTYLALFVNCI